ncbi:hypothetical protein PHSC3_000853 [Chlamydiales bacterium STE3]|nr:hypothetical protein PHSC3_000853 [Chlamydiales bacterium STE3]
MNGGSMSTIDKDQVPLYPTNTPPSSSDGEATSSVVNGKNVGHVTKEGQSQVLSKDQILQIDSSVQFNEKYNLSKAFSSHDLSTLQSDVPNLPMPGDVSTNNVAKELTGNPWLNNSFMTTLTANIMEIVRIKMSQRSQEGHINVQLMNVLGDLGHALGDLALDKAEKEAQMHMFQAIGSFISLGVTLAGGAASVGSAVASRMSASKRLDAAQLDPAKAAAAAGGKRVGSANPDPANTQPSNTSPQQVNGIGSHRDKTIKAGNHRLGISRNAKANSGLEESLTSPSGSQWNGSKASVQSDGTVGGRSQVSSGRGGPQKSKAPTTGDAGGMNVKGSPTYEKLIKRADNLDAGAAIAKAVGDTTIQASNQIGNIIDNLIQMAFKPEIGEIERETQIRQAQKQIAHQAMESASKDFSDAGQALDQALQALQKVQDENSRAHTLGRG